MLTTLMTILFDLVVIGAAIATTVAMIREARQSRIPAVAQRRPEGDRPSCTSPRPSVVRQRLAHQRRSAVRIPAA